MLKIYLIFLSFIQKMESSFLNELSQKIRVSLSWEVLNINQYDYPKCVVSSEIFLHRGGCV